MYLLFHNYILLCKWNICTIFSLEDDGSFVYYLKRVSSANFNLSHCVLFARLHHELIGDITIVIIEAFNEFAKAVKNIPARQVQLPKLKALLEQFEVQDIGTAILLAERMDEYILTPEISSPQETAVDQLRFLLDDAAAEQLIPHVNLFAYGNEVIRHDNAALTPYGLLHRADYQPMLSPSQEKQMDMGGPA